MDPNNTVLVLSLFLLSLVSNFPCKVLCNNCSTSNCGDSSGSPDVRYPFRIKSSGQERNHCGHPGFEVWCDEGYTLIELPRSGNFQVKSIDYGAQEMWINDPSNCLPNRLLTLNLSGSPFVGVYHQEFSFFNCSKTLNSTNTNTTNSAHLKGVIGPIDCLSGSQHFIYAFPSNVTIKNLTTTLLSPSNCSLIAPLVKVPVQWPPSLHNNTVLSLSSELQDDLLLSWYMPECRPCELKGQMCGLETKPNGSQAIICSSIPNQGRVGKLPLTTFVAVILVICSPTIICVVGSIIIWIRACLRRRRRENLNLPTESVTTTLGPDHIGELGLAELNIEFAVQVVRMGLNEESRPEYRPTIVISEIEVGQIPKNENENACAICMGEYRRKDRVGTLPVCGHHFHAECISKWLLSRGRFGKTCPICRTPVDSS